MSDRFSNADLADADLRAALEQALAGRRFALTVREVSPEHHRGWGMAAEFPDGVLFDFAHLAPGQVAEAGAGLGQARVEVREVDGRWRFVVAALEPPVGAAADALAGATETEAAAAEPASATPPQAGGRRANKAGKAGKPPQPEQPQAPRVVRGDELLRRVLQLLVRRAREGRRSPSPKLKAAVADGRTLALDLAILERWLPSVEQALQLEGRARAWLEAALAKRPSPERADARESLQCLLETFDRAGQPLANLARRAFADRERKAQPRPGQAGVGRASQPAPVPEAVPESAAGPEPETAVATPTEAEPEAPSAPVEAAGSQVPPAGD